VQWLVVILLILSSAGCAWLLALALLQPDDIVGELEPQHQAEGRSIMRTMRLILTVGFLTLSFLLAFAIDSWGRDTTRWSGLVTASWYQLYGNKTACGQIRTQGQQGVAHRSLPCGTQVRLLNPRTRRKVTVRVIDRGPFVAGRTFDLTEATKGSLACGDLCTVRYRRVR